MSDATHVSAENLRLIQQLAAQGKQVSPTLPIGVALETLLDEVFGDDQERLDAYHLKVEQGINEHLKAALASQIEIARAVPTS